jgi:hypothetical protein
MLAPPLWVLALNNFSDLSSDFSHFAGGLMFTIDEFFIKIKIGKGKIFAKFEAYVAHKVYSFSFSVTAFFVAFSSQPRQFFDHFVGDFIAIFDHCAVFIQPVVSVGGEVVRGPQVWV